MRALADGVYGELDVAPLLVLPERNLTARVILPFQDVFIHRLEKEGMQICLDKQVDKRSNREFAGLSRFRERS